MHIQTAISRLAISMLALVTGSLVAQGPLSPTAAPTPTMKALDELEPRINLQRTINPLPSDADYHYIISQSGSYYLSANLNVTKTHGINITVSGVTLDLNGFRITRSSGTGGNAIGMVNAADHCTIKNGAIAGFNRGIGPIPIQANSLNDGCSFYNLSIVDCAEDGILTGQSAVVESCRIWSGPTSGNGITVSHRASIARCTVNGGGTGYFTGEGCSLADCTAAGTVGDGFHFASGGYTVTNCSASSNGDDGFDGGEGGVLHGCSAKDNTGSGFDVGEGSNLSNCTAYSNGGDGIIAGTGCTLVDCTARLNTGDGIEVANHATLRGCTLSENGGHGINGSSNTTIEGCAARANDGNGIVVADASLISASAINLNGKKPGSPVNAASDGIELGARNRVLNCTIFSNGQHGVFSASANNRNYIDGCLFHSNAGFAISLQSNGNTVVRNQVGGNTTGTINQSGGNIAPIQNASDAVGVMHPLANYP